MLQLLELLESCDLEVYLFNTGRVGGPEDDERSSKVKIRHSAAVQQCIVDGTIVWKEDPDAGYLVASEMPDLDDDDLLQPRKLYERQDRLNEYEEIVAKLKEDRAAYLARFASLAPVIPASAGL